MLYDVRTYTCHPGKIKLQLALYAELGYDVQRRHLGEPLAYLQTETGDVNTFVHIWVYKDAADRAARRAAMQADPGWQQYQARSGEAGYLASQRNQLMVAAPFFTPKKP
jgi:hypothetical protein